MNLTLKSTTFSYGEHAPEPP